MVISKHGCKAVLLFVSFSKKKLFESKGVANNIIRELTRPLLKNKYDKMFWEFRTLQFSCVAVDSVGARQGWRGFSMRGVVQRLRVGMAS